MEREGDFDLFAEIINTLSNWLYTYILNYTASRSGRLFYNKDKVCAVSLSAGGNPGGKGAQRRQGIHLFLPGADGIYCVQSGNGKYCGNFNSHLHRRSRGHVLDVAGGPFRQRICVY